MLIKAFHTHVLSFYSHSRLITGQRVFIHSFIHASIQLMCVEQGPGFGAKRRASRQGGPCQGDYGLAREADGHTRGLRGGAWNRRMQVTQENALG